MSTAEQAVDEVRRLNRRVKELQALKIEATVAIYQMMYFIDRTVNIDSIQELERKLDVRISTELRDAVKAEIKMQDEFNAEAQDDNGTTA